MVSLPVMTHRVCLPSRQVFGMVEENTPEGNVLVNRHIRAGQTIHIPQGIQHFSHNPTCRGAQFLANFATADPGAACADVMSALVDIFRDWHLPFVTLCHAITLPHPSVMVADLFSFICCCRHTDGVELLRQSAHRGPPHEHRCVTC